MQITTAAPASDHLHATQQAAFYLAERSYASTAVPCSSHVAAAYHRLQIPAVSVGTGTQLFQLRMWCMPSLLALHIMCTIPRRVSKVKLFTSKTDSVDHAGVQQCDDLEDEQSLKHMYHIMKGAIMLNHNRKLPQPHCTICNGVKYRCL